MEPQPCPDLNLQAEVEKISKEIHQTIRNLNPKVLDHKFLTQVVADFPHIKNLVSDSATVAEKNIEKAKYNLSFEPILAEKLDRLLKSNQRALSLYQNYEELSQKYKECNSSVSVDYLIEELKAGIKKLESETEELETNLMSGNIQLADFTSHYLEKRNRFYTLQLKLEKLRQL